MVQKTKAASLTPDLLVSKSAAQPSRPRKQSADLSLAPGPAAAPPEPPQAKANGDDSAHGRRDGGPTVAPNTGATGPEPSKDSSAATVPPNGVDDDGPLFAAKSPPVKAKADDAKATGPNDGEGKAAISDVASEAQPAFDNRIRIPVPLGPAEHMALVRVAARSGRSCQEIMVEALFRYLAEVAGPSEDPAKTQPGRRG